MSPWSIFTQGGGPGAALTWADDFLAEIGAPASPGNEQFVYDWELSEGGGGAYNPLNQGPVPGQPQLTTTGSQYGGGAADFAGWQAGLQGAADYLAMPNYQALRASLVANQPEAARAALIASPWASSHYGYGANFSDAPVPGKASALAAYTGGSPGLFSGLGWNPLNWPGQIASNAAGSVVQPVISGIEHFAVLVPILLAAGAIGVYGFVRATAGPRHKAEQTVTAAAPLALAAL